MAQNIVYFATYLFIKKFSYRARSTHRIKRIPSLQNNTLALRKKITKMKFSSQRK